MYYRHSLTSSLQITFVTVFCLTHLKHKLNDYSTSATILTLVNLIQEKRDVSAIIRHKELFFKGICNLLITCCSVSGKVVNAELFSWITIKKTKPDFETKKNQHHGTTTPTSLETVEREFRWNAGNTLWGLKQYLGILMYVKWSNLNIRIEWDLLTGQQMSLRKAAGETGHSASKRWQLRSRMQVGEVFFEYLLSQTQIFLMILLTGKQMSSRKNGESLTECIREVTAAVEEYKLVNYFFKLTLCFLGCAREGGKWKKSRFCFYVFIRESPIVGKRISTPWPITIEAMQDKLNVMTRCHGWVRLVASWLMFWSQVSWETRSASKM